MGKDQLTSGLPDDFDGRIVGCSFIHDAKVGGGATLIAAVNIERFDGEGEYEQRYTFPRGWTEIGGQTATHESGATRINNRSQYGEFCLRALDLVPGDVADGIDILSAKSWVGLTFHWNQIRKDYEFNSRDTGELVKGTSERLFPTGYVADAQVDVASTPYMTLSGGGYAVSVPESLGEQVKNLAKSVPYAAFASAVFALPGGTDHDDLVTAVADEAFYNALR